jgi:hypothetical protein
MEMVAQMEEAGFVGVTARSLIPGQSFYAFVGTNRGSAVASARPSCAPASSDAKN